MEYEWDPTKAAANLRKHGIAFETAHAFDWETAIVEADNRFPYGEQRFCAFGSIEDRLHAVVFTVRGSAIRLIGLRKANKREVRRYEQEKARRYLPGGLGRG